MGGRATPAGWSGVLSCSHNVTHSFIKIASSAASNSGVLEQLTAAQVEHK